MRGGFLAVSLLSGMEMAVTITRCSVGSVLILSVISALGEGEGVLNLERVGG